MQLPIPIPFALAPLGIWEMIIIAVLLLIVGAIVGGVVFLAIYLQKKK